jgi:hypothetical protein
MITPIEGGVALLRKGGIYKMMKLYHLNGALFSWYSGGYVRLYESGATSVDKLTVKVLHIETAVYKDKLGRLRIDKGAPASIYHLAEGADV